MKTYRARSSTVSLILNMHVMEVSNQLHALGAYTRKEPWYALNGKLGGPHNQSGWLYRRYSPLLLLGFEIQTVQPIAAAIPLSQPP